MKPKRRNKAAILLLFACSLLALSGCGHLTIAPKPVATKQISSWAKDNILSANEQGILVTADFIRVYRELLKAYGEKLAVSSRPGSRDEGITPEGKNFRVTYELNDRFADLKYFERNSGP